MDEQKRENARQEDHVSHDGWRAMSESADDFFDAWSAGGKFGAAKTGARSGAQRRWELARAEIALEPKEDNMSVDDRKRFHALTVNVESLRLHIGDVLNLDAELVAISEHKVAVFRKTLRKGDGNRASRVREVRMQDVDQVA
eukprot:1984214-Amphidinium_carterae.2